MLSNADRLGFKEMRRTGLEVYKQSGKRGAALLRFQVFSLILAVFTAACATGGSYWIPPNSSPTPPPDLAFLFETPLPAAPSSTQESVDPIPDQTEPPAVLSVVRL